MGQKPRTSYEELKLLSISPDSKTFRDLYFETFKDKIDPKTTWRRITNIWYRREHHLACFKQLEAERAAAAHRVMIPAVIKPKGAGINTPIKGNAPLSGNGNVPSDNLPDSGELLAKCCNLLAEIVQLQKEQMNHIVKQNNLVSRQNELFEMLAASKPKKVE